MSDERFNQLQGLFREATELPPERRSQWILEQCGDDQELLEQVKKLLRQFERSVDPLEGALADGIAMRLRCPICGVPLELVVEPSVREVQCSSCGSSFSLVDRQDSTLDYRGNIPKRIQEFDLLESVGTGAFGTVWKAQDTRLDRTVAIKIPRKGQLDARELELFLREARSAAQLKHPNIVGVHEVGQEQNTVYIVSDFIEGLTLSDWLTGKRLSARGGNFVSDRGDGTSSCTREWSGSSRSQAREHHAG